MVDITSRTPFLEEHDLAKLVTTLCNYFSLGQIELARALLRIVASKDLKKASRILRIIIWHGPPRHWVYSVSCPSSSHLAWFCLIEFQSILNEIAPHQAVKIPAWLKKRLEFDLLIACALLDGATLKKTSFLTAEVANELRAYHAGLIQTDGGKQNASETSKILSLPALSVLPITPQLSSFAAYLPAQAIDIGNGVSRHRLSRQAIHQLYSLAKSQPVLGHVINGFLRGNQNLQMCMGLVANALLKGAYSVAWRHLKYLDIDPCNIPHALCDLFSWLIVIIIGQTNPRNTDTLHTLMGHDMASATSTERAFHGVAEWRVAAVQSLAELFKQSCDHTDEMTLQGLKVKYGDLSQYSDQGSYGRAQMRNGRKQEKWENTEKTEARTWDRQAQEKSPKCWDRNVDRNGVGSPDDHTKSKPIVKPIVKIWNWHARKHQLLAKIYEALLSSCPSCSPYYLGAGQMMLKLFCFLHDEYLRLKMERSSLPPAFEHVNPYFKHSDLPSEGGPSKESLRDISGAQHGVGKYTSATSTLFWGEYLEFTRVAKVHCLEYVVTTACKFIYQNEFEMAAWLLSPFPQLKPLTILLCWTASNTSLERRRTLLDVLWQSYVAEVQRDVRKCGDLWVDFWVEVLDYSVRISLWIAELHCSNWGNGDGGAIDDGNTATKQGTAATKNLSKEVTSKVGKTSSKGNQPQRVDDEFLYSIATDVLDEILGAPLSSYGGPGNSHSILYVMRPHLSNVESHTLLNALELKLPSLRLRSAASQHSYDLDLTRCYYAIRCAMYLVENLILMGDENSKNMNSSTNTKMQGGQNTKITSSNTSTNTNTKSKIEWNQSKWYEQNGKSSYGDSTTTCLYELDRLISSLKRTHLKINVLVQICSLCFVKNSCYVKNMMKPGLRREKQDATGSEDAFLVPPAAILSLLSFLRHHLRPLVNMDESHIDSGDGVNRGGGKRSFQNKNPDSTISKRTLGTAKQLYSFTKEVLWRLFIGLKDYFLFARFRSPLPLCKESTGQQWYHSWARAIGASIIGDHSQDDFIREFDCEIRADHPFRQLTTPQASPLSLAPAVFMPQMFSRGIVLLQRSLHINDYKLSDKILEYWGKSNSSTALAARNSLTVDFGTKAASVVSDQIFPKDRQSVEVAKRFAQFRSRVKSLESLNGVLRIEQEVFDMLKFYQPGGDIKENIRELSGFYILVDLAVSAAPHSGISTNLLSKAMKVLEASLDSETKSFFTNWVARLNVLVEARTEYKGQTESNKNLSLASIILGIETLPSEPALLKSHLNRLHSQRHAIMSLVESVDLVKKGEKTENQHSLVDFLSGAIRSLTTEGQTTETPSLGSVPSGGTNPDSSLVEDMFSAINKQPATNSASSASAEDNSLSDDLMGVVNSLSSSKYLLRFLEYLAKVTDLMRSAKLYSSGEDEATKLFDVLAESPKGIVARLLFELGGAKQANMLSEVMGVDLVEVILNFSWVLHDPSEERESKTEMYPISTNVIEVVESAGVCMYTTANTDKKNNLLASIACLERRPLHWPNRDFLKYANKKTLEYPALQRWVCERTEVWDALYWAISGQKRGFAEWTNDANVTGSHASNKALTNGDKLQAGSEGAGTKFLSGASSPGSNSSISLEGVVHGYTKASVEALPAVDQAALNAIGDDREDFLSAAYTRLAYSLIHQGRYEESLAICDQHLVKSTLVDEIFLSVNLEKLHAVAFSHEYLYRLKDVELAAYLILKLYRAWDVDTIIQAVSICLRKLERRLNAHISAWSENAPFRKKMENLVFLVEELTLVLSNMTILKKVLESSCGKWRSWHEIDEKYNEQSRKNAQNRTSSGVGSNKTSAKQASAKPLGECIAGGINKLVQNTPCIQSNDFNNNFRNRAAMVSKSKYRHRLGNLGLANFVPQDNNNIAEKEDSEWSDDLENTGKESTTSGNTINHSKDEKPDDVIGHLLSLNLHDLARQVHAIYQISCPDVHQIELSRLHYLFTQSNEKTQTINRLLQFPPKKAVRFAFQLLDMFELIPHRALLCKVLLTELRAWLSEDQIYHLEVLNASLELLGSVEEGNLLADAKDGLPRMRSHYLRLLHSPVLIVESLLMNARVDHLRPFLSNFPQYRVDHLILRYARKALSLDPCWDSVNVSSTHVDSTVARSNVHPQSNMHSGLGGKWCLTNEKLDDNLIRRTHVFEAAPSIKLAENLLDLLSDKLVNANLCFDIVNELSFRWQSLLPRFRKVDGLKDSVVELSHENRHSDYLMGLRNGRFVRRSTTRAMGDTADDSSTDVSDCDFEYSSDSDCEVDENTWQSPFQRSPSPEPFYSISKEELRKHQQRGIPCRGAQSKQSILSPSKNTFCHSNHSTQYVVEQEHLMSASIVNVLIRRLLQYFQIKFSRHPNFVTKVKRSLNYLVDFVVILWQVTGHKVGFNILCDQAQASALRDKLIQDDHLDLALELCERCSIGYSGDQENVATYTLDGQTREMVSDIDDSTSSLISSRRSSLPTVGIPITSASSAASSPITTLRGTNNGTGNYHEMMPSSRASSISISIYPVREARTAALLHLYDYDGARKWIDMCERKMDGGKLSSNVIFLEAVEKAIRHPPLYNLEALEIVLSNFTSNALYRKLYKSTSPLAPLPLFLFPDVMSLGSNNNTVSNAGNAKRTGFQHDSPDFMESTLGNFLPQSTFLFPHPNGSPFLDQYHGSIVNLNPAEDSNRATVASERAAPATKRSQKGQATAGESALTTAVSVESNAVLKELMGEDLMGSTAAPSTSLVVASFVTTGGGPPNKASILRKNRPINLVQQKRNNANFMRLNVDNVTLSLSNPVEYAARVSHRLSNGSCVRLPHSRNDNILSGLVPDEQSIPLFAAICCLYPPIHVSTLASWCSTSNLIHATLKQEREHQREKALVKAVRRQNVMLEHMWLAIAATEQNAAVVSGATTAGTAISSSNAITGAALGSSDGAAIGSSDASGQTIAGPEDAATDNMFGGKATSMKEPPVVAMPFVPDTLAQIEAMTRDELEEKYVSNLNDLVVVSESGGPELLESVMMSVPDDSEYGSEASLYCSLSGESDIDSIEHSDCQSPARNDGLNFGLKCQVDEEFHQQQQNDGLPKARASANSLGPISEGTSGMGLSLATQGGDPLSIGTFGGADETSGASDGIETDELGRALVSPDRNVDGDGKGPMLHNFVAAKIVSGNVQTVVPGDTTSSYLSSAARSLVDATLSYVGNEKREDEGMMMGLGMDVGGERMFENPMLESATPKPDTISGIPPSAAVVRKSRGSAEPLMVDYRRMFGSKWQQKRRRVRKIQRQNQELDILVNTLLHMSNMIPASRLCIGCDNGTKNMLLSQSNLWPDNDKFKLMRASPAGLPFSLLRVSTMPSITKTIRPLSIQGFGELKKFQRSHGTGASLLSLLVRENRLQEACHFVLQEKLSKRLFSEIVGRYCLESDQLQDLQRFFLNVVSEATKVVTPYLDELKVFLVKSSAFDLLYKYCICHKDNVNAGLLAVRLFIHCESWDERVGHLQNALTHLQAALNQINDQKRRRARDAQRGIVTNDHHHGSAAGSSNTAPSQKNAAAANTNVDHQQNDHPQAGSAKNLFNNPNTAGKAFVKGANERVTGHHQGAGEASQAASSNAENVTIDFSLTGHWDSGANPNANASTNPKESTNLNASASGPIVGVAAAHNIGNAMASVVAIDKGCVVASQVKKDDTKSSAAKSSNADPGKIISGGNNNQVGKKDHDTSTDIPVQISSDALVSTGVVTSAARDSSVVASTGQKESTTSTAVGSKNGFVNIITGQEVTEAEVKWNLTLVKFQIQVCEATPRDYTHLFEDPRLVSSGNILACNAVLSYRCEVVEKLLVSSHYQLAQNIIDFLDLPTVEVSVRASNELATAEARKTNGTVEPLIKFLEAARKCILKKQNMLQSSGGLQGVVGGGNKLVGEIEVQWDSLVSNMINIWIIEKKERNEDCGTAIKLVPFIQDERCVIDAYVLLGQLEQAFHVARKLGSLQEVSHLKTVAQGNPELLKQINAFIAYASR